jgi:hypothetical protein
MLVTGDPADAGRFKTPTLRNAGLKLSLDHVGWIVDLQDSIDYYNAGTQDTGHVQFTEDQDSIPPGGGNYNNLNMPEKFHTNVLDFLTNALTDPRVAVAAPPFDRPPLHSELSVPNPLVSESGNPGSGGFTPRMIAVTPPNLGNADCRVGIADALAGAEACVAMSFSPPVDGVLEPEACHGPFTLEGIGAGAGYATFFIPIEDDPGLINQVLYLQWIVIDDDAADGEARTPVARLTVFCHRGCPESCQADLDASGDVGVDDVLAALAAWGPCIDCPEDLNGDGVVGVDEVLLILSQWGPCP